MAFKPKALLCWKKISIRIRALKRRRCSYSIFLQSAFGDSSLGNHWTTNLIYHIWTAACRVPLNVACLCFRLAFHLPPLQDDFNLTGLSAQVLGHCSTGTLRHECREQTWFFMGWFWLVWLLASNSCLISTLPVMDHQTQIGAFSFGDGWNHP